MRESHKVAFCANHRRRRCTNCTAVLSLFFGYCVVCCLCNAVKSNGAKEMKRECSLSSRYVFSLPCFAGFGPTFPLRNSLWLEHFHYQQYHCYWQTLFLTCNFHPPGRRKEEKTSVQFGVSRRRTEQCREDKEDETTRIDERAASEKVHHEDEGRKKKLKNIKFTPQTEKMLNN